MKIRRPVAAQLQVHYGSAQCRRKQLLNYCLEMLLLRHLLLVQIVLPPLRLPISFEKLTE